MRASPLAKFDERARARRAASTTCSSPSPRSASVSARSIERADLVVAERLQHEHARAREQRRVHLERRVLGRRADQRDRAVLDVRQHRVLLRFVEAVDLVDEQHGALPGALELRRVGDDAPQIRYAGAHRRERLEVRAGRRARSLARASSCRCPAGPTGSSTGYDPISIARRNARPGPTICSCPTNSSSDRGRIRAASGSRTPPSPPDGLEEPEHRRLLLFGGFGEGGRARVTRVRDRLANDDRRTGRDHVARLQIVVDDARPASRSGRRPAARRRRGAAVCVVWLSTSRAARCRCALPCTKRTLPLRVVRLCSSNRSSARRT